VVDTMLETDMEGVFPGEYLTGDQFSDICRVALAPTGDDTENYDVPGGYVVTWKRHASYSSPRSDIHV